MVRFAALLVAALVLCGGCPTVGSPGATTDGVGTTTTDTARPTTASSTRPA